MRFWIVDGGSDDGTRERVEEAAGRDGRIQLIRFGSPNKVWQLSSALKWGRGEWVLVSDADAVLPAETLRPMITEGTDRRQVNPSSSSDRRPVLAVGTTVSPVNAHPLERLYWRLADRLRLWESRCSCASIVTGPCYLFRRALLDAFPEDVVADDIFVASVSDGEIRYVDLKVQGSRCPRRLGDLYRHKVRKADAYLREVGFLPRWSEMTPRAREIFAWRAGHLVVIPLLSLIAAGTTLAWVAGSPLLGTATVLALALAVVGAIALAGGRQAINALLTVPLGALLSPVVLAAWIKHPFSKQTANYPRPKVRSTIASPFGRLTVLASRSRRMAPANMTFGFWTSQMASSRK